MKYSPHGFMKIPLNMSADRTWLHSLNYVHLSDKNTIFGITNASRQVIELDHKESVAF